MLLRGGFDLGQLVYQVLSLLVAFTVHELAHGLVALWLGDRTAKNSGRLTLNPLRHIDWVGFLMIMIAGIGWAKPVMVDYRNFKNPKVDFALTAAGGPISNMLMAFVLLFIAVPFGMHAPFNSFTVVVSRFLLTCASWNIMLAVFNMLPLPPLDGSKIFGAILPDEMYFRFISGGRFSMIIIMVLAFSGMLGRIIGPLMQTTFGGMLRFIESIFT